MYKIFKGECVPEHYYNSVSIIVTVTYSRLAKVWQVACTQALDLIAVMASHSHFTSPLLSPFDLVEASSLR
jgi:hypothetical protein